MDSPSRLACRGFSHAGLPAKSVEVASRGPEKNQDAELSPGPFLLSTQNPHTKAPGATQHLNRVLTSSGLTENEARVSLTVFSIVVTLSEVKKQRCKRRTKTASQSGHGINTATK